MTRVKRFTLVSLLFLFLGSGSLFLARQEARADDSKASSQSARSKTKKAKASPTPGTRTFTPTRTATPKRTFTPTKTATKAKTPTPTRTFTFTRTFTLTRTPTATPGKKKVDLPPLYLADAKNEVTLVHKGEKKRADPPQRVEQDDRILTGSGGKAYLQFASGGTVEIGPNSDVKVSQLNINDSTFKARFQVAVGKMRTIIHKLTSSSSSFEVEAGGVVSGVRGTTFEVDYDKEMKQAATKTYDGTVYTLVNGKETLVQKGMGLVVGSGGVPVLNALGASDIADFVSFIDASDKLEAAKQILLKKLEQRLLDEAAKRLLGGAAQDVGKALQFHF